MPRWMISRREGGFIVVASARNDGEAAYAESRRRPSGYAGHASPFGSCVAAPRVARRAKRGGARRDRTDDLMLAKHALSQLSYGPVPEDECFTLAVRDAYAQSKWWAWEDLNFRPHAYQARALTN